MKIKYFFTALAAALTLLVSCSSDEDMATLNSVQVSSSYVALPAAGGSTTITVRANGDWEITEVPGWLKVAPEKGTAGETDVTFTVVAATKTNTATVKLNCNGETQLINVLQQTEKVELPLSTCKEVINGADGDTYRVKGTVTRIVNTTYGNWYLVDQTGEIYIYGTLDKSGAEKNFLSLGLEAGDIVTVEGPKTTYGSTVELVNVTVVSIEKSLGKVNELSVSEVAKEGGEFTAYLTCKGDGVSVETPVDWLSVKGIKTDGENAEVTFAVAPNDGGERSATLTFVTTSKGKEYTATADIVQKGSIVPVTVAEFEAAAVGDAQYRLTGLVTKVDDAATGKYYISDYTGNLYVYKASGEVALNDVVTLVGKRAEYKGVAQVGSGVLEETHVSAAPISCKDFNAAADDNAKYYVLTGTITEIANEKYGNLYIEDGSGEKVYLYGCYGDWSGVNKQNFVAASGIAVGDKITVVTVKTSYNGTAQGKNAVCFGIEKQLWLGRNV